MLQTPYYLIDKARLLMIIQHQDIGDVVILLMTVKACRWSVRPVSFEFSVCLCSGQSDLMMDPYSFL